MWTSSICVFSQGVLTHYPWTLGIGTVNTVPSSPVLVLRQQLFLGQRVLILNGSSFKYLSIRGRLLLSDWKPGLQYSLCLFSSPPLPSTLGMPTSQWSAFPEMAIMIKSISWKPKCFPNCLKSHRREDVTTDWKRRRKQSQVHDAFPFYKQSQMRPTFSKLSDLLF